MEKWEIRTPLPQKPLNRSSPKFAWLITSWTPTPMQNFIKIPLPTFAPQIRENACRVTRLVFLVLPPAYSQDPYTDFHDQYVKWRRFAQGCAFWGSRKQNFTFRPHFPQNTQIFGQFLTGLKLPLIVIVAPWKLYSEQAYRGQQTQIWGHRRPLIYRSCDLAKFAVNAPVLI